MLTISCQALGAPLPLKHAKHGFGQNPLLLLSKSHIAPVVGTGHLIVPIGAGIDVPLIGAPINSPLFVVDPKCNSILSSNKAIENDSNLDLHLNNSYNSIEYNHNSPTSSYYTSSISSLQYSSSDNGYNSCTESTFSLSPLPINQFEWIDNLIYEARNEIENEKTIMVKKYIKRKNHSTKVSSLMTDVTELKNSKKHSLSGMNYTEKARRKKEQNRIAAQRYRIKQKATEKAESEEMKYLKDRNAFLRAESARLEKEIEEVKNMMLVFMR